MSVEELVLELALEPHPEGGFYRQTYRSEGSIARPEGFSGPRSFSTAIYFLLPEGRCSMLHRIRSDEVWHFYAGGPLELFEIDERGALVKTALGADLAAGQLPQYVVKAGRWFGASPFPAAGYSLVGCTVAPGFDFSDFELARRAELLARYPHLADLVLRLTPAA